MACTEQYTIRGFSDPDRDSYNVVLLDGMRMGGNRYSTQTNNVQSVEVLKGPSSVLYGRGAVGGTINIVRKKPQAVRAYDFSYRGGRFNTHQIAGGATGAVGGSDKVLYRLDSSFEASDGWRDAGADRFNLSPALTWLMTDRARLTVHQTFNRDRFDGDGGVPLNIIDLPSYKPELRFSLPQDRVLVEDSQTQAIFSGNLSPAGSSATPCSSSAPAIGTSSLKGCMASPKRIWSTGSRLISITSGGRSRTKQRWLDVSKGSADTTCSSGTNSSVTSTGQRSQPETIRTASAGTGG